MWFLVFLFIITKTIMCDFGILLVHTNDMHGRLAQTNKHLRMCKDDTSLSCYGGFARLHATIMHIKEDALAQGVPTIFLNAGDNFQGTPFYSNYKWPIIAKFINMLGVDVMSLGNHEFDDGIAGLVPYINSVKVPVVCSNMDWSHEPNMQSPNLSRSKVLVVNGTKVGIIGYLTPNISNSLTGNLRFFNEVSSVRMEAQNLIKKGTKIIIALGHSGYPMDLNIAREVDEIDLVVGGHTHSFLFTGRPPDIEKAFGPYPTVVTQLSGKQVPVVQAFFGTKYLGRLEMTFDNDGNLKSFKGSPVLLRGTLQQSSSILRLLEPYEKELAINTQRIIGYTHVQLDSSNFKCKLSECNIGNMITDAYVNYVAGHCRFSEGWTASAIGMTQGGSIRASIDSSSDGRNGSLTVEDVITVVPFGNRIVVLRILGSELLNVLEHAVARYELTVSANVKEFIQVSGLRVVYDLNRGIGNRVVEIKVLCADCKMPKFEYLNLTKVYGVTVPEFIAHGGDGFSVFTEHKPICVSAIEDYKIVSKYIETYSPLNPRIEGRIKIIRGYSNRNNALLLIIFAGIFLLYFCIANILFRFSDVWQQIIKYDKDFKSISTVVMKEEECMRLISENVR